MAFQKTVSRFVSADGEHSLNYYVYSPVDREVRALLQLSHGMCEYVGRYEEFFDYLTSAGILCFANDHLGHGTAAKETNTLGFFAQKEGWHFLPADLHQLTLMMKQAYPDKPVFLLGHSMGSFVARLYLAQYGEELAGAVIMGTSGKNPMCDLGIKLANFTANRKGAEYKSPMLKKMSTGSYGKLFPGENPETAWLTKDTAIQKAYAADELCSFTFSASAYRDLFTMLKIVTQEATIRAIPKELPVLVTSGRDDPLGKQGKGVAEVAERMRAAGVKDVSLKLYGTDRHEILNELDRQTVYADILAFLEKHL